MFFSRDRDFLFRWLEYLDENKRIHRMMYYPVVILVWYLYLTSFLIPLVSKVKRAIPRWPYLTDEMEFLFLIIIIILVRFPMVIHA